MKLSDKLSGNVIVRAVLTLFAPIAHLLLLYCILDVCVLIMVIGGVENSYPYLVLGIILGAAVTWLFRRHMDKKLATINRNLQTLLDMSIDQSRRLIDRLEEVENQADKSQEGEEWKND